MNSKMPSPVGVLENTAEEYREQQVSEHAGDVFHQAEGKLRMLRDSGGGVALARLINALYNRHKALKFVDLMPLDRENRSLALALIREYLEQSHSSEEWESLAELAQRCAFGN